MRTPLNFERAMDSFGVPKTLVLDSEGGLVHMALSMARDVHRLKINTLIPERATCYSSCSFIFLAGNRRLAEGDLGVHQLSSRSSDLETGQMALSDIIDILGRFNTPHQLLVDMLRTPPEDIYVLSQEEKLAYNLYGYEANVRNLEKQSVISSSDLSELSLDFLISYHKTLSLKNSEMLLKIGNYYAKNVNYFGKSWTSDEVLMDKREFSARWPARDYSIKPKDAFISCASKLCTIDVPVDFYAKSEERDEKSRGIASTKVKILFTDEGPKIIFESSKVIHRYE